MSTKNINQLGHFFFQIIRFARWQTIYHLVYNNLMICVLANNINHFFFRWSGLAVTIGEVIETAQPHIGHADWHMVLTGVSRRQSLQLALQSLAHMYKQKLPTSFISWLNHIFGIESSRFFFQTLGAIDFIFVFRMYSLKCAFIQMWGMKHGDITYFKMFITKLHLIYNLKKNGTNLHALLCL